METRNRPTQPPETKRGILESVILNSFFMPVVVLPSRSLSCANAVVYVVLPVVTKFPRFFYPAGSLSRPYQGLRHPPGESFNIYTWLFLYVFNEIIFPCCDNEITIPRGPGYLSM